MAGFTPNLLITLIAQSQNLKEITFNSAIDSLDEAMCSNKSETMTDADFTIPAADFQLNGFIKFSGPLTAGRNVILPSGISKWAIVVNNTGQILTFKNGTATLTVAISDSNPHLLFSDGAGNVYKVS